MKTRAFPILLAILFALLYCIFPPLGRTQALGTINSSEEIKRLPPAERLKRVNEEAENSFALQKSTARAREDARIQYEQAAGDQLAAAAQERLAEIGAVPNPRAKRSHKAADDNLLQVNIMLGAVGAFLAVLLLFLRRIAKKRKPT